MIWRLENGIMVERFCLFERMVLFFLQITIWFPFFTPILPWTNFNSHRRVVEKFSSISSFSHCFRFFTLLHFQYSYYTRELQIVHKKKNKLPTPAWETFKLARAAAAIEPLRVKNIFIKEFRAICSFLLLDFKRWKILPGEVLCSTYISVESL